MNGTVTTVLRIATVLIGLAIMGVVALVILMQHPWTDSALQPITQAEFTNRFSRFPLPSTATNVLYASASVGLAGRALLYRFDAPASDCLRYAQSLIEVNNRDNARPEWRVAPNLIALTSPPAPAERTVLQSYGLERIEWWDVQNVRAGFSGHASPSGLATFWVDTGRGRFYYYWTD